MTDEESTISDNKNIVLHKGQNNSSCCLQKRSVRDRRDKFTKCVAVKLERKSENGTRFRVEAGECISHHPRAAPTTLNRDTPASKGPQKGSVSLFLNITKEPNERLHYRSRRKEATHGDAQEQ